MSDHTLSLLLVFAGPLLGFFVGRMSRPRRRWRLRIPSVDRQTITPAEAHALDMECSRSVQRAGHRSSRARGRIGEAYTPVGDEPSDPGPVFVGHPVAPPPPPRRIEVTLRRAPPPSSDD